MSDASEVKQKDIHIHHQSGKAFILVELHNRIMAERDELWKRATKFVMPGEMDTGESIEHYIKTLEQTVAELKAEVEVLKNHHAEYEADCKRVEYFNDLHDKAARQAKVIEKLKRYTQHRVDCIYRTGVFQYSNDCDCGLKAIEQGEGM